MYSIERKLRSDKTIVEYIDCQNPGLHHNRWWSALEAIVDRIYTKAWSTGAKDMIRSRVYKIENAGMQFLNDIRRII